MGKSGWSLLHDIGFAYYMLCMFKQGDEKAIEIRFPLIRDKYMEWLSDNEDSEKIINLVIKTVSKYLSNETSKKETMEKLSSCMGNIKNNLSIEHRTALINDLFFIVNSAAPIDVEIDQINKVAQYLGVEINKTQKPSKGSGKKENKKDEDKGEQWTLLHDMCYLYCMVASFSILGLSSNDKSNNKDNMTRRYNAVQEKISEWSSDDVDSSRLVQKVSQIVISDIKSGDLKKGYKIDEIVAKIKKYMPEENHQSVIEDLQYIINIWSPNKADDEKILGSIRHLMGVDEESSDEETLAMAINDAKDCLTKDTDPPYPGQFCISGTLYEGRFAYMPFPQVVGKGTKYKAEDMFRRFTPDEVSKIVAKIKANKQIPYLVFVKEILETKMDMGPFKAPFWFMPFVITGRDQGTMLYFFQDGFWNNRENPHELKQCCSSDMIKDIEITDGHFIEFIKQPFKEDMPDSFVDDDTISTLRVSANDDGEDFGLEIAELHGKEYGPQLEIVKAIWNIWKHVVEESKGASSYIYDPPIFKTFHSWQEVIDWAYEGEEKAAGKKKDKAKKKVKTDDETETKEGAVDPAGNLTAKGVLAGTQEKWDEAEKLFTEAIRINQSFGAAYRFRAVARDNLNNLEDAIKDLDKCIELDGGDAEAYRIRGRMKGRLGKDLEATEDFSNSIKHEKDKGKLSMSYRLRGYAQYQLEDYKNAISDYDQATKLDSKNAESYYFRGLCKQKIGMKNEGLSDFKKAAELGFEDAKKLISEIHNEHATDGKKSAEPKIEKEDEGGASKGKRTTYTTWLEFEKEQSAKDQQKNRFMPIAKNIHELIISTFKENKMPFEVRYGDGTFSFSVPQDLAKSKKRTCARCGLLNFKMDSSYIESLYKDAADELPKGAKLRKKEDPTEYFYNFASLDDFEKVKQDIKKGVLRSYKILAM